MLTKVEFLMTSELLKRFVIAPPPLPKGMGALELLANVELLTVRVAKVLKIAPPRSPSCW